MNHTCSTLLIRCIDFRLAQALEDYLREQKLLGDTDIISVAGSIKNLISPTNPADADFLMRQIEASKRLHGIKAIILVNHTDCGAYGGNEAFGSANEELARHTQDLNKTAELIAAKYAGLTIRLVLAKLQPSGEVELEKLN